MNDTLTYTLLDLQTYIRRVIAANMQETVWITAELSSCSESRGHWYIDLVQKDQANIAAQASAVLWATNFKVLLKKLSANTLAALLREGVQVRMEVRVEYHERYGMKLVVQDLDPAYTLGQLEAQRRASLQRLYEERLLDKQKQIVLPIVVQRIAVISSTLSAGYQDFIQHLNHNIYGYKFQINLFDSAVQGESTVSDIVRHFDYITKNKANFDAVCVLRGGGSRLDLAAFDDYKIAASAAVLPLPLLVGIGHDIDESVLDAVAHTSLKTPTAVADFLIDRTAQFESRLLQQKQQLHHASSQVLKQAELRQAKTAQQLQYSAQHALQQHAQAIQKIDLKLPHVLALHFQKQAQNLDLLEQKIDLLQPNHILKRGFSMTLYENKPILNAADIPKNAVIETLTQTGKLKSRVLSIAIFIFCLSANSLLAQKLGPNLIDNGDFEKGNHSFSSEVPYITCHEGHNQCGNGKYMCSGTYTIAKSPYPCNPDWGSGLKDHTSKTGNMLILDYYEDHQARLWTQTVKVKPNTSYIFRTWVANLSPFAAPSSIQLIGGTQKSPIITVLNNSNWDIFSTVIKTNNETELELSINSANNGLMGYDIAFDDITLQEANLINSLKGETPPVKTPLVKTPLVKTPLVKTPLVKTPLVKTPLVKTPLVKTPPVKKTNPKKTETPKSLNKRLKDESLKIKNTPSKKSFIKNNKKEAKIAITDTTTKIVTRNIAWGRREAILQVESFLVLDELCAELKKHSNCKLQVISHTDTRGAAEPNLQLSLRRSQVVAEYLIKKGIDSDRLTYKGLGESEPLINCPTDDDCDETQHAINRRTEFLISR